MSYTNKRLFDFIDETLDDKKPKKLSDFYAENKVELKDVIKETSTDKENIIIHQTENLDEQKNDLVVITSLVKNEKKEEDIYNPKLDVNRKFPIENVIEENNDIGISALLAEKQQQREDIIIGVKNREVVNKKEEVKNIKNKEYKKPTYKEIMDIPIAKPLRKYNVKSANTVVGLLLISIVYFSFFY